MLGSSDAHEASLVGYPCVSWRIRQLNSGALAVGSSMLNKQVIGLLMIRNFQVTAMKVN
jgi:hypothetical protein